MAKPLLILPLTDKDIRRFWAKVQKRHWKQCWNWTGKIAGRYGSFYLRGGSIVAHRIAYTITIGDDPGDFHVCHTCDNTFCVNPRHLWLGTHLDNMKDMVTKNRQGVTILLGDKNPSVKLTKSQVLQIVNLYSKGYGLAALGRRFDCSDMTIYYIVNGVTWNWLTSIKSN